LPIFHAFDLNLFDQGRASRGPNFATRHSRHVSSTATFFGNQLQLGNPNDGARGGPRPLMFFIILAGVCLYLFLVQRAHPPPLRPYDGADMTVEQARQEPPASISS